MVIDITPNRGILCACLIGGGFTFFLAVSKIGQKLLEKIEAKIEMEEAKSLQQPVSMIQQHQFLTSHL